MDKYQNKYRIASARAQWWDYGWNGAYFVTICTKNRECFFGEIRDGVMHLSQIGEIANHCWLEIPQHFPFVKLDKHVVMPNHVHGIVIIDKPNDGRDIMDNGRNVETQNFASLRRPSNQPQSNPISPTTTPKTPKNQFGPQSKNLASIIRGFKTGVTINAREILADFAWQSRFHDHIIRDDQGFQRIADYIVNNPANWNDDNFYTP